jgi:isoleucyl-tRNA synthetase
LQKRAATALSEPFDPHRPGIDAVKLSCDQCDGLMTRVLDVADVWFDSGSMPLAQWHYPFENKKLIDSGEQYPADFIAEGIDQTRGWFYTLLAVAALLDRKAPYKNVVSLGLVNDADGKKMSKRLGNLIVPTELFPKFGADAVRFYLYTMSQAGDFKNFDLKGVDEVVKKLFFILMNVLSFYELHQPAKITKTPKSDHILDSWILAKRNELVKNVTEKLEAYDLTSAGRTIAEFVTDLSTWYLRRSRDRFREPGAERDQAGNILRFVLLDLAKLLAPFSPMIADALYVKLSGGLASVHLEAWPKPHGSDDEKLLQSMVQLRRFVEAGHAARASAGVRVRQPLGQVAIKGSALSDDLEAVLKDELNVMLVSYAEDIPSGEGWAVQDDGTIALALNTVLTDKLREAGWVRELARHINDARKELGVTREELVHAKVSADQEIRDVVARHEEELKELGKLASLEVVSTLAGGREVAFDGHTLALKVEAAVSVKE